MEDVDQFRYRSYGSVVSKETNRLPFAVFDDLMLDDIHAMAKYGLFVR